MILRFEHEASKLVLSQPHYRNSRYKFRTTNTTGVVEGISRILNDVNNQRMFLDSNKKLNLKSTSSLGINNLVVVGSQSINGSRRGNRRK